MLPTIKLSVIYGPHKGQEQVYANHDRIAIGRAPDCSFQLHGAEPDMLVSRWHCLIQEYPDRVEIRDLESSNGTWVNGKRLGFPQSDSKDGDFEFKRRLVDGDQIVVGASVIQVKFHKPSPAAKKVLADTTVGK